MPKGVYTRKKSPWNKGKKGWVHPGSFYKGRVPSKEETEKLKAVRKGVKRSEEFKKNVSETNKRLGKKPPTTKGKEHYNWQGGITPETARLRHSVEYRLWREAVFKRDKHTCVWCLKKGGKLEADHIQEWAKYPELRFAIDNGRTMCRPCHLKRHGKKV